MGRGTEDERRERKAVGGYKNIIFNIEVRKNSIFTTSEEEEYKRCWPRRVRAIKQKKRVRRT